MFRFKRGIKVPYKEQGLIYFMSLCHDKLPRADREEIDRLCRVCGKQYAAALKEFVTTEANAVYIAQKYYIDKATLYRCVKRYYESFRIG